MPILSGENEPIELRKNNSTKTSPIIEVSVRMMHEGKQKFLQAGCNEFVINPIHINELRE